MFNICTKLIKKIGNLLSLSVGFSTGWATINLLELKSENSSFPGGQLTEEQLALVISISNIGGFTGNFAVGPISKVIGIKRAIHSFGLLLIVRKLMEQLSAK